MNKLFLKLPFFTFLTGIVYAASASYTASAGRVEGAGRLLNSATLEKASSLKMADRSIPPSFGLKLHRRIKIDSDTTRLRYPLKRPRDAAEKVHNPIDLKNPLNIQQKVEFDPKSGLYVISSTIDGKPYLAPVYMTFEEYSTYKLAEGKKEYWALKSGTSTIARNRGLIPTLTINSKFFEKVFGGNTIDIRPTGEAGISLGYQFNRNDNPIFTTRQRSQGSLNFQERIQMNVTGQIGDKLKINTNYNTESQFDFENQIKLEYTGKPDEIVQKIELGNVSMPLPTQLIQGTQNLFGLKAKFQFGRLGITGIFSQQKSQNKTININNGTEQNTFSFKSDNYDANRHFFLAQYFRDNYNRALSSLPIINTPVLINRIEVWITNRTSGLNTNARDVIGFQDLGERVPYNPMVKGGVGTYNSPYPSSKRDPVFNTQPSNNLLEILPPDVRNTNSQSLISFFQSSGGTDNYGKVTYARRLDPSEFTLNPTLGYISLSQPLNADEVLTCAYVYTVNGIQYQVGELSSDVPVNTTKPTTLYTKLLKNAVTKVNLPIWKLQMKNIYSIGATQINPSNFTLNVTRLDTKSGVQQLVMTEGSKTTLKRWLQLLSLDNFNSQQERTPDGQFDFLQNVTIDAANGYLIFPVLEPFGSDLAKQFAPGETDLKSKYVYQQLYDSTKFKAQQFPSLNTWTIKGTYQSSTTNVFNLDAFNIPQGSVRVTAGNIPLVEGQDFTVDYNLGKVTIVNTSLLSAGIPISINVEDNSLFGVQQRTLMGARFDYVINSDFKLGATLMNLSEKPLTQNVNVGSESINNTEWGLDGSYRQTSRWLTNMVNKIPFLQKSNTISSFALSGEFAQLIPGHNKALNVAGDNGVSYVDDFESTSSIIDLRSANGWALSGTPQRFSESNLTDNLSYGYNRSLLSFYNIDPIFYSTNSSVTPGNINKNELSSHRVRQVNEQEIFPALPIVDGQPSLTNTFDLAFYPTVRGPYNFDYTQVDASGQMQHPQNRWGGVMRGLQTTNFEALNVQYIEMWVMDPFLLNPTSQGGTLYFDLGSISEDILKDGRKSLENGLPVNGLGIPGINAAAASNFSDSTGLDTTAWGAVPRNQPVTQSFDNDPNTRSNQDVGLDGLVDKNERLFFKGFLNRVSTRVTNQEALSSLQTDPASDDFHYFTGADLDRQNAGVLKRYEFFNGTEGNSSTANGLVNSASTSLPDQEDVNRDNNMSTEENYYEYKVEIKRDSMQVGHNNIVAIQEDNNVKLANGGIAPSVKWYQIKIPIANPIANIGGIQDFKTIRFVRMYMTGFQDTTVLRFGRLQLRRGEWLPLISTGTPSNVIKDDPVPATAVDRSAVNIATVSVHENSTSRPNGIEYVTPPGIVQQQNLNSYQQNIRLNESSLSFDFANLSDGFSKFAYKILGGLDTRRYKRIKMFIHLEDAQNGATSLSKGDVHAVIRLGSDYTQNYYEYDIPLQVTPNNSGSNQDIIWPVANNFDVALQTLIDAKLARNKALLNGAPWPSNVVFSYPDPSNSANIINVLGNPDLSNIAVGMLGVRNPYKTLNHGDDGQSKSGQLWFDELRLADYDESGGWAATARANVKLADFANITATGFHSTAGFGSLQTNLNDLNRFEETSYDVAANVDMSKFFPKKAGLNLPLFFYYSHDRITPQYDPNNPDILLDKEAKSFSNKRQRDSVVNAAIEVDTRKSFNLTNIRKLRTNPNAKPHFWDIENFSLSYSYNEATQRNYLIQNYVTKTYKGILDYAYSARVKNYSPFKKWFKSKWLQWLHDINITPLPSVYTFRMDVDRYYAQQTQRANVGNGFFQAPTAYNKTFYITRNYGLHWDLTKSLQIDFQATNYSTVDEPPGKATKAGRDSVRRNFFRGGRTTDYTQNVAITYNVPFNKIRALDWITLAAKYQASYEWRSASLAVLQSDTAKLGNSIQNQRQIDLEPTLDFTILYRKWKWLARMTSNSAKGMRDSTGKLLKKDSTGKQVKRVNPILLSLVNIMTSIKSARGTYLRAQGTYLPGFLPSPTFLGNNLSSHAPGFAFIFGSQKDIRGQAAANSWVTPYKYLQAQYVQTFHENVNAAITLEPVKDFRIDLTAVKDYLYANQATFKYDSSGRNYTSQNPVTSGTYSISNISIASAFERQRGGPNSYTSTFADFSNYRTILSERLGRNNPNSKGDSSGYASGYGPYQQDVLIGAFLAAYNGTNPSKVSLGLFKSVPLPGWRISYSGLSKLPYLRDIFSYLVLTHAYRSVYTINSYSSNLAFKANEAARDESNNFIPRYQVSFLNITENFDPLIGLDMRFKNNVTLNIQYSKDRIVSLSLANAQMAQQNDKQLIIGAGYHVMNLRLPFSVNGNTVVLKNDLQLKLDIARRDSRSMIFQLGVPTGTVAGGLLNWTLSPSVDYNLSRNFNFRIFYNGNTTKPYTSNSYNSSFSTLGIALRYIIGG